MKRQEYTERSRQLRKINVKIQKERKNEGN